MPQSLYRPTRSPPGKLTQLLLLCARTSVNWEIVLRILEYCATRKIQSRNGYLAPARPSWRIRNFRLLLNL